MYCIYILVYVKTDNHISKYTMGFEICLSDKL